LGIKVALFAVDFNAPESLAYERIGRYQMANNARDLAERSFMASLAADVSRPEPWLLQGELMLSSGRLDAAFNFIRAGIARSPVEDRALLIKAAAAAFARRGVAGEAQARALLESLPGSPQAK
jgi:predicted Zn-dependent protease